jgi:hypothetical protein
MLKVRDEHSRLLDFWMRLLVILGLPRRASHRSCAPLSLNRIQGAYWVKTKSRALTGTGQEKQSFAATSAGLPSLN